MSYPFHESFCQDETLKDKRLDGAPPTEVNYNGLKDPGV